MLRAHLPRRPVCALAVAARRQLGADGGTGNTRLRPGRLAGVDAANAGPQPHPTSHLTSALYLSK